MGREKKWSRKDTREISRQMTRRGQAISPSSVGRLLKDKDYSLRVNRKDVAETHHPERDAQFKLIDQTRRRFEDEGHPILSVDSKNKELIGDFRNCGRAWGRTSLPVYDHDFRSLARAIAAPYGMLDIGLNLGTIVVGISADTAEFAADAIETWLTQVAYPHYQSISKLLILCDSGGSNGCRNRLWKVGLYHKICRRYGIDLTVCHYPPGASKWNPVEHRLFSFVSLEWAGVPLRTLGTILRFIRGTNTEQGLRVHALLNRRKYLKGIKIPDDQFNSIRLQPGPTLPDWNYTIKAS